MKNKKWLTYLAIISIIFILISAVLAIFTPKKVEILATDFTTTNKDGSSSQFSDITFTGFSYNLPEELPVAVVEKTTTTAGYVETQLIENFSLVALKDAPNIWNGQDYSLTKDQRNGNYLFAKNQITETEQVIKKGQALKIAESFLAEYFPDLKLTPLLPKTKYFSAGLHLAETDEESAEVMEIPFAYSIENFPVLYAHSEEFPFKIMIYSDYQIQKVSFQPFFVNLKVDKRTKTIPIYQAVENINNNKAAVIAAYQDEFGELNLETIKKGELKNVTIEYRVDEQLGIAYPFYRFKGTLINDKDIKLKAEIITPAVETF